MFMHDLFWKNQVPALLNRDGEPYSTGDVDFSVGGK